MTNSLITDRNRFAAAAPEERLLLNGRDWGIRDTGTPDRPALLLIPGTLGRGDIFWQQIEALSGHLRILAISYPDTGGIREWTEDLVSLLDQKGLTSVHVLGSSLGGYLAQYFAGTHPEKVGTLFAANTLHTVNGLDANPPYSLDLETAPIDHLRAGFGRGLTAWADSHPDQKDLVELLLEEAGGRILEPELRARLAALKHGPELPTFTGRVVTIDSADDPLIPQAMREAVRDRLRPQTAYHFLWGGHFPYCVRPALYTAILARELNLDIPGPDWGPGTMVEQ
ncbi:alpha/beta fold hydrolase [Sneathiella chinensis]|uniref:Maspardin n=1 Tax=Sneathiella chinensis TaxID=349750 RepID=A0ABQ5TZ17_9PROT|nr:alpha/beta hydrolase [Sneathiella chinensis]GLQ05115.1 hypothetical protein GCM10007924_03360 [Sneathiella chinensis]